MNMLCWIVPDNNLIIAGSIISPSGPGGYIMESWRNGDVGFVTSMPIINELENVLRYKGIPDDKIHFLKGVLMLNSRLVEPRKEINIIKDDPPDNRILEAAVEGKADFIVSNDKHLLRLRSIESTAIVTREHMANLIREKKRGNF